MSVFSKIVSRPVKSLPILILLLVYLFAIYSNTIPAGLGYEGFTVMMIFIATVYLWATEILPLAATAFLAIMLLAVSES